MKPTPAPPLLADRDEEPEPQPTERRRPPPRTVAAVAALVVVAIGLFSVTSLFRLRGDLLEVEGHLTSAKASLDDVEVDQALAELEVAGRLLVRSRQTLSRPDLRLASFVPVLGKDIRIARALVIGADDVVRTGSDALDEARSLLDGDLADDGLPVAAIAALAPRLHETADAAVAAVARVQESPRAGVTEQVTSARARFLELLTPVADQVVVAADLADALPPFLGAEGPRRYLLAAANPAELRGVGGYLGSYSVLTVRDGQLDFGSFQPLEDLPPLEPDAVPRDLLAPRYERFGATWNVKNANMTPDMPSASRLLLAQFEQLRGRSFDGVMVVDPFALAAMLEVTGPIRADDGTLLDADNAVRHLVNEAYEDFEDNDARKEELGGAATAILSAFLADAGAAIDHLADLGDIVVERHLLLYSVDADEQAAFAAAGLDGSLPDPDGDFVTAVVNSATNAKVDFYLSQHHRQTVRLLADGVATSELELTFDNGAPTSGAPKYVLGPSVDGLEAGDNRFYLSTFCATSCTFEGAEGGLTGRSVIDEELGHPVAGTWVEVPAGGRETLRYAWRTDDAWVARDGELVYRLFLRPQAMVRPVTVEVDVVVPDGFVPADDPGPGVEVVEVDGRTVLRFEDEAKADLALEFRMRNAETE